jgi:hypothetical protein
MHAKDRLSGIFVCVKDAGAQLALPVRTLLRNRGQNCRFFTDRELNTNEIFPSLATTLSDVGRVVLQQFCNQLQLAAVEQ